MLSKHFAHLFFRLFIPVAMLLLAGIVLYGNSEVERELTRIKSQESLNVGLGTGALTHDMVGITSDLLFLSNHSTLQTAVNRATPRSLSLLTQDFANFSRSKGIYDQIRWLDETGMERGRVDFRQGTPLVVPAERLQSKGKRYYFTDAFRLNLGEVFVSPLDLNIERGRVEVPYKPMIRVGTPIFDRQGEKSGIVLLNYYGADLLRSFTAAAANIADHVALVNSDGYWLKSPREEDEWGFMLKRPDLTLASRSPQAWKHIQAHKSGQQTLGDGLWSWDTVYPLLAGQRSSTGSAEAFAASRREVDTGQYSWKVVAHLPADTLGAVKWGIWRKLSFITLLLLALIGLGNWKLASAWAAQAEAEEEVRRVNDDLEKLVNERTRELHNKVLELDVALDELRRRNEDMEGMIYIASHDLRSPLVNIQGFGKRLEKVARTISDRLAQEDVPQTLRDSLGKVLDERMPTALGFIKSSSEKMDALINGLLRLSRAGRAQLDIEPLDMDAMLAHIIDDLTIQLEEADGKITVDPLPPCMADTAQLNQAFTNIIDNAIKYREPSRSLEIRINGRSEKERVIYEIADNSIGIPAEQQSKIWLLFHRLDPAGPIAGEGIGLTLVHRIVDRMRGHIRLQSVADEGSRFIIELPAVKEAA